MRIKLFMQAISKMLLGIISIGLLIFLPAGTIFANGLLLMVILFVPMFVAGIVMLFKNPDLLRRRLNTREKQKQQKTVVRLSTLIFIAGFIVSGLTVRLGWYILPQSIVDVAAVVFLAGYALYVRVLKENPYLSRIIEIQQGQKVIGTGLYGMVRHPMYSATLFMFLSMPVILGSIYAFLIFLTYPFIIAKRIKSDTKKQNSPQKVRGVDWIIDGVRATYCKRYRRL